MVSLSTGATFGRMGRHRYPELDPTECGSACRFIESLVAAVLEIEPREIRSGGRGNAAAASARHAAMYLAHVCLGMRLSRVAEHFGRDRTTVAYACARVEDRRDNPSVDCVLACLETAVDRWRKNAVREGAA